MTTCRKKRIILSFPESPAATAGLYWGFAKLVKASDSESDIRRFESYIPSQIRKQYNWGFAKLVKAPDFDSGMRRFESYIPSHLTKACTCTCFYFCCRIHCAATGYLKTSIASFAKTKSAWKLERREFSCYRNAFIQF